MSAYLHASGLVPGTHASAIISVAHTPGTLTGSCGRSPGIACSLVWNVTHNSTAARLTAIYLAHPISLTLRLVFLTVLALLIRALVHRLIDRITQRTATLSIRDHLWARPSISVGGWRRFRHGRAAGTPQGAGEDPVAVAVSTAEDPLAVVSAGEDPVAVTASAGDDPVAVAVEVEVGPPDGSVTPGAEPPPPGTASYEIATERRLQRASALASILRSIASFTIFGIAAVTALGDLGVNLGPVLASAGVVGVAVGFGAQNLVRDFISGVFMLIEDQYGVGDVISVNGASGTVETVSLRITRLRDVNGVVWHIRNGSIEKVGNESQGWSRAVIDLPLPHGRDIARARAVMEQVVSAIWSDPQWRELMLEKPDVWGVQNITGTAIVMRVVARTPPLQRWTVACELRQRLKSALDAASLAIAADPAEPTLPASGAPGAAGTP